MVAPLGLHESGLKGRAAFRGSCLLGRGKIAADPECERNGAQHKQNRTDLCEHPFDNATPRAEGIEPMAGPTYAVGGVRTGPQVTDGASRSSPGTVARGSAAAGPRAR